jgi:hypothetical protein
MNTMTFMLCGILYRLGGAGKKYCRMIILPVVLALYLSISTGNYWYLLLIASGQILRIGDGIPGKNPNDPKGVYDKGSFFGRLLKIPWLTSAVVSAVYALAIYFLKFIIAGSLDNYMLYIIINAATAGVIKYLDVAALKYGDVITEVSRGFAIASIIFI